jgi:hypothetical protein
MSEASHQPASRLGYRFLAIYAILYALCFPIDRLPGPFIPVANIYARGAYSVESWVAKGVFGITAPLRFIYHPNGGGDSITDFIRLFCIVVLAALGAVAWLFIAPRHTPAWFHPLLKAYLRYFLATMILLYGIGKIVPGGQFNFPSLDFLLRPLGDLGRSDILPAFMGSSYPYTLFAGLGETVGGLLLLSRRTAALGGLMLIPILLNVLVMNLAYGWDVKVGSGHYLLIAIFLAAPLIHRLVLLAIKEQSAPPVMMDSPILLRWPRTRVGLKVAFLACLGWLGLGVWRSPAQWGDASKTAFFGIWDVEAMELGGRPLPSDITESQRWRTVIFERDQRVIVRRMNDSLRSFGVSVDTFARTIRLAKRGDTTSIGSFAFTHDRDGRLRLIGTIDALEARLTLMPSKRRFRLSSCPMQLIVDRAC